MNKRHFSAATVLFGTLTLAAGSTQAAVYTFDRINSGPDIGDQFEMETSQTGTDVMFTFTNVIGVPSAITDVYFDWSPDDPPLLTNLMIDMESPGVSFQDAPAPADLPNGNLIGFESDMGFDADPSLPDGGIDDLVEYLVISATIGSGLDIDDFLASGALRVGLKVLHAQGGGSGSYANEIPAPAPVPVPGAVWLFSSALAGFGWLKRKRAATA